jgi:hypothetical protein
MEVFCPRDTLHPTLNETIETADCYKTKKTIWVMPYKKGTNEKLRKKLIKLQLTKK